MNSYIMFLIPVYWCRPLGKESSRIYPSRPIIGVGAVVIHDGKILLVERAREPYKGYWTVPGGVQRVGETLEEAVLRELEEETGITGRVKGTIWVDEVIEYENGRVKYHYVIIDMLVEPCSLEVRASSDASRAEWFSLDEAMNLKLTDTMRAMLEFIKKSKMEVIVLPYYKPRPATMRDGC